jgi:heme oxygenase
MPVCDYRSALQTATAPLHADIDAQFGGFDLADRDGLTRFLAAQAIGMAACQPRITRFGRDTLGCTAPDYRRILLNDLAALGVDAAQLPRLELADRCAEDAAATAAADAGTFYVVAGSRMGAAVLRDRATALTPAGPANSSCGYFIAGDVAAISPMAGARGSRRPAHQRRPARDHRRGPGHLRALCPGRAMGRRPTHHAAQPTDP